MLHAPLDLNISEAPKDGAAYWAHSDDGVRIRVGLWHGDHPDRGTVFIFPGRTEYIEKYGRVVSELLSFGLGVLVIDWRGQGLADRLTEDPMTGHVGSYSDYQWDVAAMMEAARTLMLPQPWHLIGHSMGACIGLRSIMQGLPVSRCAFSSPMWNINLPPLKRAAAWPLAWGAKVIGKGHAFAPGTGPTSYVLDTTFEQNRLTNDPDMYQYFIRQARGLADRQLGGPSMGWLFETLMEARSLSKRPSPNVPCVVFCGGQDEVVDIATIEDRMAQWPGGEIELIAQAKHDVFSEVPDIRQNVISKISDWFS